MYEHGYNPSPPHRKMIGISIIIVVLMSFFGGGYWMLSGSGGIVSPLPADTVRIIFETPEPVVQNSAEATVAGEMVESSPTPAVKPTTKAKVSN